MNIKQDRDPPLASFISFLVRSAAGNGKSFEKCHNSPTGVPFVEFSKGVKIPASPLILVSITT